MPRSFLKTEARWLAAAASLALLGLSACSGSQTGTTSAPPTPGAASSQATAPAVANPVTVASPSAAAAAPAAASPAASQAGTTVTMDDSFAYKPASITVARGTAVTWKSTGGTVHTVTDDPSKAANKSDAVLPSGAPSWDSGDIPGGGSYTVTFNTAGNYCYFCVPQETLGMVGKVTVTP